MLGRAVAMPDNAEVVRNDVMEEAVGGVVPHCLWDGVNDDWPFSGKKTFNWSRRSLSTRQACQGTMSWTGSQILGRSLESANCLSNISPFQYKHLPNTYQPHPTPSNPIPLHEGEIFLHLRHRNKVTARNLNYQLSRPRPH